MAFFLSALCKLYGMKHYSVSMQSNDNINNDGDDDRDELDNVILLLF